MSILQSVLAVLLLQSLTPRPTQQPPPATASIEGSIVGASGERLPKVLLKLTSNSSSGRAGLPLEFLSSLPPEQAQSLLRSQQITEITEKTVLSDTEGKFIFESLRPGTYTLEASRSGFVTTLFGRKGAYGRETPIILAAGQKLKDIQLPMIPAGNISGTILDRNGEPISLAVVQALKYGYSQNGRGLQVVQSVTTNDLGEYRLFWLPPGSYLVSALPPASGSQANGIGRSDSQLREMNNPIGASVRPSVTSRMLGDGTFAEETPITLYYPGTAVSAEAALVAVRAAETVSGVNITANPVPVHRIRGVTLNANGQPESMSIALVPKDLARTSRLTESSRSNSDGTFELTGVTSGSYFLLGAQGMALSSGVHSVDTSGTASAGLIELTVGNSDISNVRLSASAGFTLKGRILQEGSSPPENSSNTGRLINLTPIIPLMPGDSVPIARDDTFVFPNVLPGDYQIDFFSQAGDRNGQTSSVRVGAKDVMNGVIKSVRLGGQEVTTDGIHVRSRPEGELTIVISTETGKLQGRVVNGRREPASNATIVVVPEPSQRHRTNLFFGPKPDAVGKFSIDVPPGHYKVFAWEDVEPLAWFDADFMQAYESRGQSVTIGSGSTETVEVEIFPYMPQ